MLKFLIRMQDLGSKISAILKLISSDFGSSCCILGTIMLVGMYVFLNPKSVAVWACRISAMTEGQTDRNLGLGI